MDIPVYDKECNFVLLIMMSIYLHCRCRLLHPDDVLLLRVLVTIVVIWQTEIRPLLDWQRGGSGQHGQDPDTGHRVNTSISGLSSDTDGSPVNPGQY